MPATEKTPFWPRKSPHFMRLRVAVRQISEPSVTVGVSGGADSMALAAALLAEGYRVHAVCVDHGLQPYAHVQQQVREQLLALGAQVELVGVIKQQTVGQSTEAYAREARYAALFDAAQRQGNTAVAVGHTQDDQAETLILSALRGHASGMQLCSPRPEGTLWRPLLQVPRTTTAQACAELGLRVWQDPHNENPQFLRVGVRQQVVPLLSELLGGDAAPVLALAADRIAQDNAALHTPPEDDCRTLASLAPAQRRRAIMAWLQQYGAQANAEQLQQIEALVLRWRGQQPVRLASSQGGQLEVHRKSGRLSVNDQKG